MDIFKNIWASFVIFFSNFNAKYGTLINLVLILALLAIFGTALVRTYLSGRVYRKRKNLSGRIPDKDLTERAAQSLASAIQIPTVTGDKAECEKLFAFLRSRYPKTMQNLGCLFFPNGGLMLRWKSQADNGNLPVMFCGHIDVVPPGEGWSVDPFGGERRDGRIYGRGALDCKNIVIAHLEAIESLLESGFSPKRDLYFCYGNDEETGGTQSSAQIGELLVKRGLEFDMILDEGDFIKKAHLGHRQYPAAAIGIAEKGFCNIELTANVDGGHSSTPLKLTATGAIAEAICRIEAMHKQTKITPEIREYLDRSAPAMTFGKRFAVANLPFSKPIIKAVFKNDPEVKSMLHTTYATTSIETASVKNVIPTTAKAVVNVRLSHGESSEQVCKKLEQILSDLPITVEKGFTIEPSKITSTESSMYQLLCNTLDETYSRLPCIPSILPSATDTVHYSTLSDCILRFSPFVVSPNAFSKIHAADEYITEQSLGMGIEVYTNLIKKL